jgi:hypothetical protein
MSRLIDTTTSRMKFEKRKLPVEQCFGIIQDFWKEISLAQDSLVSIYAGLNDGEEIDSDQSSNLISSIQQLKEPVQSFYRFLEHSIHLPNDVGPLRYQLLIILHDVDVLSGKFVSLVLALRSLYSTQPSQVTPLRPEVLQQLAVLTQRSEDILMNIQILHLQVCSRMKRPITSLDKTGMLTSLSRANYMASA